MPVNGYNSCGPPTPCGGVFGPKGHVSFLDRGSLSGGPGCLRSGIRGSDVTVFRRATGDTVQHALHRVPQSRWGDRAPGTQTLRFPEFPRPLVETPRTILISTQILCVCRRYSVPPASASSRATQGRPDIVRGGPTSGQPRPRRASRDSTNGKRSTIATAAHAVPKNQSRDSRAGS